MHIPHLYLNPASAIWTVISFVFIVYSIRALMLFLPALRKAQRFTFNGRRKRVAVDLAKDYVIGESVRLASHLLSVFIGVQSFFVPPIHANNPIDRLHATYSLEVLVIIIGLNVLSGANSMRAVRSWLRRDGIVRGHNVETILARMERRAMRQTVELAKHGEEIIENSERLDALEENKEGEAQ